MPKALILDCEGPELSEEEWSFFQDIQPLGFILFQRHCKSPEQVKALVQSLKECVEHNDVPILIDQEGGRVARLKPPHWPEFPPAGFFAEYFCSDEMNAVRACYLNARLMACELAALGITVDCAPVLDIRVDGAHAIIGDRAYGAQAESIIPLARAVCDGLMEGGVSPVIKHIPGHGRALVDSHEELPVVKEEAAVLREQDFVPFKALADAPMAMTAHIVYDAFDKTQPATLSKAVIDLIRNEIGFDGLLMSDDITMKALKGELGTLAEQTIVAGCDVVLLCNATLEQRRQVAAHTPELTEHAKKRVTRAFSMIKDKRDMDMEALRAEYASLITGRDAA